MAVGGGTAVTVTASSLPLSSQLTVTPQCSATRISSCGENRRVPLSALDSFVSSRPIAWAKSRCAPGLVLAANCDYRNAPDRCCG